MKEKGIGLCVVSLRVDGVSMLMGDAFHALHSCPGHGRLRPIPRRRKTSRLCSAHADVHINELI